MKQPKVARVLATDDYTCCNCGKEDNLTVDHIIPKKYGGRNHYLNLQTLCWRCNWNKRTAFSFCRRNPSEEQINFINNELKRLQRQGIQLPTYFTRSKAMNKKVFYTTIPACNVDALLRSTQGRWFSIRFIKADGSMRRIVGKLSSTNQLVNMKYPHRTLWDSHPDIFNFRKANLSTTTEIVADHVHYIVR